ncbi:unnamed protein product [Linum tenue]|uniref:Uncharacterized protein n=1 Tax=Linum tenue TaxID=586396 RepID=A0AAV0MUR6_9ROSI|nr:unnamed protein product [Linum tenue]
MPSLKGPTLSAIRSPSSGSPFLSRPEMGTYTWCSETERNWRQGTISRNYCICLFRVSVSCGVYVSTAVGHSDGRV